MGQGAWGMEERRTETAYADPARQEGKRETGKVEKRAVGPRYSVAERQQKKKKEKISNIQMVKSQNR